MIHATVYPFKNIHLFQYTFVTISSLFCPSVCLIYASLLWILISVNIRLATCFTFYCILCSVIVCDNGAFHFGFTLCFVPFCNWYFMFCVVWYGCVPTPFPVFCLCHRSWSRYRTTGKPHTTHFKGRLHATVEINLSNKTKHTHIHSIAFVCSIHWLCVVVQFLSANHVENVYRKRTK